MVASPRITMKTGLAPMEGLTTFPARLWLTWASQPERMTTPFLRVNRAQPERELPRLFAPELGELRGVFPYELVPQFLSADTEGFLRAATFLDGVAAPTIELNCGCPCPTCIGKNAGSGILADPNTFERTLEAIADEIGAQRFAVKMRLGYSSDDEFDDLLGRVAPLKLARLSVHGRTRADGYKGRARWQAVETAARKSSAPTWGSGDIVSGESLASAQAAAPTAYGAMIGRGAIRNPWIFEEIRRGEPIRISATALANALFAYALVQELATFAPEKLLNKLANAKLVSVCKTSEDAWKDRAAALAALVFGVPVVWSTGRDLIAQRVSPTTMARLRLLWMHLRTSLPEAFSSPRLARAKTLADFFSHFEVAVENDSLVSKSALLELRHRPKWDAAFSGEACTPRRERAGDDTLVETAFATI